MPQAPRPACTAGAAASTTDPLPLAQALIRCRSVTPADGGAQEVLAATLEQAGFTIWRLPFGATPNLFARRGAEGPHLCFAGHTDVVPEGAGWSVDPFAATLHDNHLFGRGACDMKGAIAAFAAAAVDVQGPPSVSFLITGDEEGPATNGTVRVLDWMQAEGHIPDLCVVGEPTNPEHVGEVIKIGRRGSLNAVITIEGVQGHVAYPAKAYNPIHPLIRVLADLTAEPLDAGTDWFQPSSLQLTSVDVGNAATNIIPDQASARLNIRFNDRHTGASLSAWLRLVLGRHTDQARIDIAISGESFLTKPGPQVERLAAAIGRACGIIPRYDTGGGTSDARFIARYCPVAEFGLVGATMHQVDERVSVEDLRILAAAYRAILTEFA